MKKILSFLFILIISKSYSATGSASDGELGALVILALIALIVGTGYFVNFLKRIIKNGFLNRLVHRRKPGEDNDTTYFDKNSSLSQVIPG